MQRRQRVLMNASLIEAHDQQQRARIDVSEVQQHAQKISTTSSFNKPPPKKKPDNIPQSSHIEQLSRPTNDLPKTGLNRSDEPQSWSPRARSRDN